MPKSISIIGAGMAGLAAGCYGQMNGYRTQIFEMQHKPGGLVTGWEREGYTIGTTGWLMGSGPAGGDRYQLWQELGAIQGRTFLDYEEYAHIQGRDGQVLTVHTNIDRLEEHLHELAPEDKDVIDEFISILRVFTGQKLQVDMGKWMGMTLGGFGAQFKNPFLSEVLTEALPVLFFFEPDASVVAMLGALSLMHMKAAGYPLGGALPLARAIEQRYLSLGGVVHYRSPVVAILVENDRAVGVRLEDGAEHRSDVVISAADGRTTIFDMLEGQYVSDEIHGCYDALPVYSPILLTFLGVARTFEKMPFSVAGDVFALEEPVTIAGRERRWLGVHTYGFDPSLAPDDKTLIRVMLPSSYAYWSELRAQDRAQYRAQKEKVLDQVVALLDRRYPGLAAQVEMRDLATPATFERFTGNWQGTWLGWLATPQFGAIQMSQTLPGLAAFYMAGQWVKGGSLPTAASSGKQAIQMICDVDGKPFETMLP